MARSSSKPPKLNIVTFEDEDELYRELNDTSGGPSAIAYIPADGIAVRFMTEPVQWVKYYEHFTDGRSHLCTTPCAYCSDGVRRSTRWLAPVIDLDNNEAKPIRLPGSLMDSLRMYYERNETLTDRNFDLGKRGEGLNTKYFVTPDVPSRISLSKYETPDLIQVLTDEVQGGAQTDDGTEDDDDYNDDVPPRSSRVASKRTGPKATRQRRKLSGESPAKNRTTSLRRMRRS